MAEGQGQQKNRQDDHQRKADNAQLLGVFAANHEDEFAHQVVCDNQGVADYVASAYSLHDKIKLIAYGGDHVCASSGLNSSPLDKEFALSICRVEPENNV